MGTTLCDNEPGHQNWNPSPLSVRALPFLACMFDIPSCAVWVHTKNSSMVCMCALLVSPAVTSVSPCGQFPG